MFSFRQSKTFFLNLPKLKNINFSVIRGAHPRVGDRVMVEANYNPSMPFKWNAYRIQMIQDNAPQQNRQPAQQQQNGGATRWGERMGREEPPRRRVTPPRDEPGFGNFLDFKVFFLK